MYDKSNTGRVLSFGRGTFTIHFPSRQEGKLKYGPSTMTGYDNPDTFNRWRELEDGCIVIDKRAAVETPQGYKHVFNGPMVNVDLPDNEAEEFDETLLDSPVAKMVGGAYSAIAQHARSHPYSLAYVGRLVYADGWREAGARIGKFNKEKKSIEWEK